jgi:hypothetical protein
LIDGDGRSVRQSRREKRALIGLALGAICLWADVAPGQVIIERGGSDQAATAAFQVTLDESLETAFADFERHVGRQAWDKAFQPLMDLPADKQGGMLPTKDGYLISARARIREALSDLPPDGREAFRIFYDARAQKLYDELVSVIDRPAIETQSAAEQLFDRYFLTSVGDNAADLLAEMYFEQGRFDDAAGCWGGNEMR